MSQDKAPPSEGTAVPQVNFTITSGERARALIAGPPAYALRGRRIELLEEEIVRTLVRLARKTGALPESLPRPLERKRAALNELVAAHNAYYPIEANLPVDITGRTMDGGEPWVPMEPFTAAALIESARRRQHGG